MVIVDKEKILRESVKRLLELNISDSEVVENLKSVGVEDTTAKRILKETKDELGGKAPKEKISKDEDNKGSSKKSFESGDIYSKVYDELEEEKENPPSVVKKPIKNPSYSSDTSLVADKSMAELWENGILATVNSKLNEMEKIKMELDSILDKKISVKVASESKKIETILESQRTLFNSKVDSHLELRADELTKVVESRAKNLEDIHAKVQEELIKVQSEKTFNTELLNNINEKTASLEGIKNQMISDTNTSLITTESKFNEFMAESKGKRDELEARVNRALQLESKITEGLIQDAKHKIDSLTLAKEEELTEKVQVKLHEFEEMAEKVDPQGINDMIVKLRELEKQIVTRQKEIDVDFEKKNVENESCIDNKFSELGKEFDSFKKQISKIEDSNTGELRKEYAANVDDLFVKNLVAWNKQLKEKETQVDVLVEKIDLEKFNATMDSLDLFKQQFVNTINTSIQDYNKSKRELSQSIIERDKAINSYLKKIDAKMQHLTGFEKKFAISVSELIDSIPEEKLKKKKQPKPKSKS